MWQSILEIFKKEKDVCLIIVISLFLLIYSGNAFAQCGSAKEIDAFIAKEFKETKVWTGLSDIAPDEQQLTFIYENPENGNWTIAFYSLKNDKTCILMMGQASTFINTKTKGSKS